MNLDFDPTADPADQIHGFRLMDLDMDEAAWDRLDARYDALAGPVTILG